MKIIKILFIIFLWICFFWLIIPYKILYFISIALNDKKCVWCGNKDKLKFIDGRKGDPVWEYRNVDGSRDKRSIDNFTTSKYFSRFECKKIIKLENGNMFTCNAVTEFIHKYDKNPNGNTDVYKGTLAEKGQGQRTSSDFRTNYKEIDIFSENRKNS